MGNSFPAVETGTDEAMKNATVGIRAPTQSKFLILILTVNNPDSMSKILACAMDLYSKKYLRFFNQNS